MQYLTGRNVSKKINIGIKRMKNYFLEKTYKRRYEDVQFLFHRHLLKVILLIWSSCNLSPQSDEKGFVEQSQEFKDAHCQLMYGIEISGLCNTFYPVLKNEVRPHIPVAILLFLFTNNFFHIVSYKRKKLGSINDALVILLQILYVTRNINQLSSLKSV